MQREKLQEDPSHSRTCIQDHFMGSLVSSPSAMPPLRISMDKKGGTKNHDTLRGLEEERDVNKNYIKMFKISDICLTFADFFFSIKTICKTTHFQSD